MDKKDEIILQQMDIIKMAMEKNMSRIADDFWGGAGRPGVKPDRKPDDPAAKKDTPAAGAPAQPEKAEDEEPPENIEDLKKELDGYIGLESIKDEVRSLINLVNVYNLRKENGLKTADLSLHMVFSGNPGTGKTMIARLMARIYRSLGILSKGQLIEVDRGGLVAGYVGQTAIKTGAVIKKALGGVLFIDEAYALSNKSDNDFGQEAIDTLLKAMEDNRDDLVVIVAGYDGLMQEFIHSNPGLESRFNCFLHFEDYTPDELIGIFKQNMNKNQYQLAEGLEDKVKEALAAANTDPITFGNGRGVRNVFETIIVEQANRIAALDSVDRETLLTITAEDIDSAMKEIEEANEGKKDPTERLIEKLNGLTEKNDNA